MSGAEPFAGLPLWVALPVALLLLLGAGLSFLGAVGLVRLATFYERLHAPALAATLGIGSVLLASLLFFSAAGGRVALHEVLIGAFLVLTTPITLMLLARAARARDAAAESVETAEGKADPRP